MEDIYNNLMNAIIVGTHEIRQTTNIRPNKITILLNEYSGKLFIDKFANCSIDTYKTAEPYLIGTIGGIKTYVNNDYNNNYGPFAVAEYEIAGEKQYKVLIDTKIED